MNELVASFAHEIAGLSPGLSVEYRETMRYWAPDDPPPTIVMGDLGNRIVDDFNLVDRATNEAVFNAIEDALAMGDTELFTAVATGMIEAIVGRAIRIGIWDEVLPMFGKLSRSHAIAWASP
jgi:hypothetical protein